MSQNRAIVQDVMRTSSSSSLLCPSLVLWIIHYFVTPVKQLLCVSYIASHQRSNRESQ
jgi:hypothetical protein